MSQDPEVNHDSLNFWMGSIDQKLTTVIQNQNDQKRKFEDHEILDYKRFETLHKALGGINKHRFILYGFILAIVTVIGWHIEMTKGK